MKRQPNMLLTKQKTVAEITFQGLIVLMLTNVVLFAVLLYGDMLVWSIVCIWSMVSFIGLRMAQKGAEDTCSLKRLAQVKKVVGYVLFGLYMVVTFFMLQANTYYIGYSIGVYAKVGLEDNVTYCEKIDGVGYCFINSEDKITEVKIGDRIVVYHMYKESVK